MRSGLPRIMKAFRNHRSHVKLDLAGQTTRAQLNARREEASDVGFVFLPIDERGLQVHRLFTAPMVVVLPEDHRLADRSRVPLRELENEPHVMWTRSGAPRLFDAYVRACHEVGFTPRIVQEIRRGESFLGLVEAGLGVSIAHAASRRAVCADRGAYGSPTLGLARRHDDDSPLLTRFLETVEVRRAFQEADGSASASSSNG